MDIKQSLTTLHILSHMMDCIRQKTQLYALVLWHINHCRLFNAKSSLYIYIKYIGLGLVRFYGTSTIVGYLMPTPLYTYILDMSHINHCRSSNTKSSLYIYIKYMIDIFK